MSLKKTDGQIIRAIIAVICSREIRQKHLWTMKKHKTRIDCIVKIRVEERLITIMGYELCKEHTDLIL